MLYKWLQLWDVRWLWWTYCELEHKATYWLLLWAVGGAKQAWKKDYYCGPGTLDIWRIPDSSQSLNWHKKPSIFCPLIFSVSTAQWKQNTDQEVGTCMHTHTLTHAHHAWCHLRRDREEHCKHTYIHTRILWEHLHTRHEITFWRYTTSEIKHKNKIKQRRKKYTIARKNDEPSITISSL